MIQAFYTSFNVARWIGQVLSNRLNHLDLSVLDVCAGSGSLISGLKYGTKGTTKIRATAIEPDSRNRKLLIATVKEEEHLYEMTAEEYNLTYAEPRQFDLVICNPPFGPRCGETQLGELVTQLHLPEITRFESYFLLTAGVLAKSHLVFILPNTYANHPEAQSTFESLWAMGWSLSELVELPLDAFESALVSTSLCIWRRDPGFLKTDWVQDCLAKMKEPDLAVVEEVTRNEHRGHHGPIRGYLAEGQPFRDWLPVFNPEQSAPVEPQAPFAWSPTPKPEGTLWERMGCMYALTPTGWEPANIEGYAQGKPINASFQIAKDAHALMQQGAFETGHALLQRISLPPLVQEYGQFAFGSFLHLLHQRPVGVNPVQKDLKELGLINLATIQTPLPETFGERRGPYLVSVPHLNLAQKCQLFLEGFGSLQEIAELKGSLIPHHLLELRSPWIPRESVAAYLGIALDKGLYDLGPYKQGILGLYQMGRLASYLNYGKGDRIKEGDLETYSAACDQFATDMNDWASEAHTQLRFHVHAHFHLAHQAQATKIGSLKQINPAKPLHFWQKEDIPFLLQGEAICNWDVGLGKTAGAMAVAASHPGITLIVVPKPVLSKWQAEFRTFFPNLPLTVLGYRKNRGGKWVLHTKEMEAQAQKTFSQHSHQVILTTHQVFARFTVKDTEQVQADRQDAYDLIGHKTSTSAQTARARFVKSAADRNFLFGGTFSFTDLPLSNLLLIVDEGHQFKSLFPMPSTGWGNQLVMAGSCGTSKRARDMKIKADLIRQAGGKTLCLTATPVSNSVVEAFNMWRIWAPSILRKRGILNPQQFIDLYCQMEPITAVSPTGKIVSGTTIAGFRNLEALQNMWETCMITRTAQDVRLPLPQKCEHKIEIEPTPSMNRWMHQQKQNLEDSDNQDKVHIFTIISNLDAIAAHPPLVGISDNPKGEALSQKVCSFYNTTTGGQIIFSDRVESHEALATLLVQKGIPRNQIDILNGSTAPNIDDRLAIQERFNSGITRVVIGGVVASEGIDLQRNCVAIHFNNLTWESQSIHQRVGRGVRQGNQQAQVHVFYYLLKSSTDIYRFATTQNKKHWWDSLRGCQTESTHEGIFSDPISDGLIASIALDPIATQAVLKEKREAKEKETQAKRFTHLLQKMMNLLDPIQRQASQPILEELERSLRNLHQVPDHLVHQGLQRAQAIAQILHQNRQYYSDWRQAVTKAGNFFNRYHGLSDFFKIELAKTPRFTYDPTILKTPFPLASFPSTLIRTVSNTLQKVTTFRFERNKFATQPTLKVPSHNSPNRFPIRPTLPADGNGVWVQLSLFS